MRRGNSRSAGGTKGQQQPSTLHPPSAQPYRLARPARHARALRAAAPPAALIPSRSLRC